MYTTFGKYASNFNRNCKLIKKLNFERLLSHWIWYNNINIVPVVIMLNMIAGHMPKLNRKKSPAETHAHKTAFLYFFHAAMFDSAQNEFCCFALNR